MSDSFGDTPQTPKAKVHPDVEAAFVLGRVFYDQSVIDDYYQKLISVADQNKLTQDANRKMLVKIRRSIKNLSDAIQDPKMDRDSYSLLVALEYILNISGHSSVVELLRETDPGSEALADTPQISRILNNLNKLYLLDKSLKNLGNNNLVFIKTRHSESQSSRLKNIFIAQTFKIMVKTIGDLEADTIDLTIFDEEFGLSNDVFKSAFDLIVLHGEIGYPELENAVRFGIIDQQIRGLLIQARGLFVEALMISNSKRTVINENSVDHFSSHKQVTEDVINGFESVMRGLPTNSRLARELKDLIVIVSKCVDFFGQLISAAEGVVPDNISELTDLNDLLEQFDEQKLNIRIAVYAKLSSISKGANSVAQNQTYPKPPKQNPDSPKLGN